MSRFMRSVQASGTMACPCSNIQVWPMQRKGLRRHCHIFYAPHSRCTVLKQHNYPIMLPERAPVIPSVASYEDQRTNHNSRRQALLNALAHANQPAIRVVHKAER